MRPMLAHHYVKHKHTLHYPLAIQPKLDGIRCLYHNNVLQSRNARTPEIKTWRTNRLLHIRDELRSLPSDILLDGELYIHGRSRQEINGLAAVNALEDKAETAQLEFWVFDCVNERDLHAPFSERHGLLSYLLPRTPHIKLCRTEIVMSEAEGDILYHEFKNAGYEGGMYRLLDEPYGFVEECGNQENRWKRILKRKEHLDGEFRCVGVVEGEGKYAGTTGALVFQLDNGLTFNAGSGLSDAERDRYWSHPPIDQWATIRYDILSQDGIPIQPRIEEIYD